MDFDDSPELAVFRAEVRAFLDAHARLRLGDERDWSRNGAATDEEVAADYRRRCREWQRTLADDGKTVAAICHAPWLLVETGIAKGRKMTSYKSIKTDVANAGAQWEDSAVVTDNGVITSRNPGDLEAFSAKIIEEVREGRHQRRAA